MPKSFEKPPSFLENLQSRFGLFKTKKKAEKEAEKKAEEQEKKLLDELFENFTPETDKKKLTKSMRKRIIDAEKLYQQGIITTKDLVAPTSVQLSPHNIKIGEKWARTILIFNYPRYLETNWLSGIINYDASFDLSLFVYPTSSAKIMKILRRKVAEMMSSKNMNRKAGKVGDPALELSLKDAEELRMELQKGNERFFQVGIYLTLYADTEDSLKTSVKQVQTILGGQLIMTRGADFRAERGFDSTLPQCTDMLEVTRNMNTAPLSTTFPFVSSNLSSNTGVLYGLNRHNNSLIIFDRFALENANQVVFAKSGAGKSYAVKLEVLRSLMLGTDVIILDPENEYEALAKTVGGAYLRVSLSSGHRINPFDLPPRFKDQETKPGDLLRENIINLLGLLRLMLGKMTPFEESLLDKALLETYARKGILPSTQNPTEMEMPLMQDLEDVLNELGGESLAVRLEKFTKGTFQGIFNEPTNIDLENGLVIFSIRDLEDELRPMAMYILLNFIWARVRSSLRKRILVVDEAWNLVQYEESARFLHNLAKRARKYFLGITTITQDTEDFLGSRWGKPIITNSSIQLLLRQSPSAVPLLKKVFNLTEGEEYLLLNSGVGQGLFFAGNQHVAIQVIASFSEDKIVTTKPQDKV